MELFGALLGTELTVVLLPRRGDPAGLRGHQPPRGGPGVVRGALQCPGAGH